MVTEITIFTELARYGLLGILLCVIGWAYYKKDAELRAGWEARVADNKQLTQIMEATNHNYAALALAHESRTRASEAVAQAAAATARALEQQAVFLDKMVDEVEKSRCSVDEAVKEMRGVQRSMDALTRRTAEELQRINRTLGMRPRDDDAEHS